MPLSKHSSVHMLLMQATFLRGASALFSRKTENPALAAELEELDSDQLDTRCRRNGLSKKGGRDMQVCAMPSCKHLTCQQMTLPQVCNHPSKYAVHLTLISTPQLMSPPCHCQQSPFYVKHVGVLDTAITIYRSQGTKSSLLLSTVITANAAAAAAEAASLPQWWRL